MALDAENKCLKTFEITNRSYPRAEMTASIYFLFIYVRKS